MSRRSRLFVTTQVKDWGQSPLSRVPDTDVFTPGDISPALWLDASDTSTITASSGDISQWNNKGSLGNFTQATGAVQPKTGVTTLNGLNVVDFAGDYLTAVTQNEWKFLHDGTKWVAAFVVKVGTTATPDALYGIIGTSAQSRQIGLSLHSDTRTVSGNTDPWATWLIRNTTDPQAINTIDQNRVSVNNFAIVTQLADPANGTAADRNEVFKNDGTAAKSNTVSSTPSTADPTHSLQIGASGNNVNPFTGSIAEIVIATGANATETNRADLRDYLNQKWGVY